MSFTGRKNYPNEMKLKEKADENLKITINDKIFETMTRNNTIREKIHKINQKNYLLREDEEFLDQLIKEVQSNIQTIKNLSKDFDNLINRKYSQDVDMKDKLTLIKQQINQTLEKEILNYNNNVNNFEIIKANLAKKGENDYNESNDLLNSQDEECQKYKVSNKDIKYMEDISAYRKTKFEHFYSETLKIQKITEDINMLTHQQDKKISSIDDNIEPVLLNAKETFKKLIQTSDENKAFKNNNCCIMAIIIFAIFFLLLISVNLGR